MPRRHTDRRAPAKRRPHTPLTQTHPDDPGARASACASRRRPRGPNLNPAIRTCLLQRCPRAPRAAFTTGTPFHECSISLGLHTRRLVKGWPPAVSRSCQPHRVPFHRQRTTCAPAPLFEAKPQALLTIGPLRTVLSTRTALGTRACGVRAGPCAPTRDSFISFGRCSLGRPPARPLIVPAPRHPWPWNLRRQAAGDDITQPPAAPTAARRVSGRPLCRTLPRCAAATGRVQYTP